MHSDPEKLKTNPLTLCIYLRHETSHKFIIYLWKIDRNGQINVINYYF